MVRLAFGSITNADYGPTSGGPTTNYGGENTHSQNFYANENILPSINYGSGNNNLYSNNRDYAKDNEQDGFVQQIDDENQIKYFNDNNDFVYPPTANNINQYGQHFEQNPYGEEQEFHHHDQQIGHVDGNINHQVDVINYVPMPVVKKIHVPYKSPVQIPISHAVLLPIRKPVPIHIPVTQQVQVPIEKELKIPVERVVPFPVERQIPVPIEKHIPYQVIRYVPLKVSKPFPIKVPVVKTVIHKVKESW